LKSNRLFGVSSGAGRVANGLHSSLIDRVVAVAIAKRFAEGIAVRIRYVVALTTAIGHAAARQRGRGGQGFGGA
jgi:hypothetical protein